MADGNKNGSGSGSPDETYNPLQDELGTLSNGSSEENASPSSNGIMYYDAQQDIDQKCDSMDLEKAVFEQVEADANRYGSTPPITQRMAKRERAPRSHSKEKHAYKGYKELKVETGRQKPYPRTYASIIKERYIEDHPSLCRLSGTDSDDNTEKDNNNRVTREKKRRDKRDSKARTHERNAKRHSDEYVVKVDDTGTTSTMSSLSSSADALTFRKMLAGVVKSSIKHPLERTLQRRRSNFNLKSNCPSDRTEFYRIFSTLISMGTNAKSERDRQLGRDGPVTRQLSTEQEIWNSQLNEGLWLDLKAKENGLTFNEQKDVMEAEQRKIPSVLDEILMFKFKKDEHDPDVCDIDSFYKDIIETYYCSALTSETLSLQDVALNVVENLLNKLNDCEVLFTTTKALGQQFPLYNEDPFKMRVESLYLWLNLTRDLCGTIKVLGRLLGIFKYGVSWPIMEDVISTPATGPNSPDIPFPESDDKSPLKTAQKSVRFLNPSSRCSSPLPVPSSPVSCRDTSPTDASVRPLLNISGSSPVESNLDEAHRRAVYRYFVDRSLKKMGMNKLLIRLRDVLDNTLQRAKEAMQVSDGPVGFKLAVWLPWMGQKLQVNTCLHMNLPWEPREVKQCLFTESPVEDKSNPLSSSPSLDLIPEMRETPRGSSLSDHGIWRKEFMEMKLPSFRPNYLFLVRVPLDVIHECLCLRLEQRPVGEPSSLGIKQLIRECKEVLRGAVIVKQYYQYMVAAVLWDEEVTDEKFASDLEQFDNDMRNMLEVYLTYLQNWMNMLQSLPEASRSLRNDFEEEWIFTKEICPHIIGGEAEAGKRFSTLACSLLSSIADFLEGGIDEFTTSVYDLKEDDDADDEDENDGESAENDDEYEHKCDRASENRHFFQSICRSCKNLFHEARERSSKALGFAKMLRKDLEIAADFDISVSTKTFLDKLKDTNHVQVIAPVSFGYLLFIPQRIISKRQQVLQLLNVTCGREDSLVPSDLELTDDGYLLMVQCDQDVDAEQSLWSGMNIQVEPTAETAIALSHIQVEALLLVVIRSSQLAFQRKEFVDLMGIHVSLVNEQTSCHQAIADSLVETKTSAMELCEKISRAISQVDEKLIFDDNEYAEETVKIHLLKLYRETMLQCYNFGFEYHKEVTRLVSGEAKQKLGRELVNFARKWMKFVMQKCERGRGTRPRWATQGLDFLTVACEPKILTDLSDDEFQEFKNTINDCIGHIVGSAEKNIPHGIHSSKSTPDVIGRPASYSRYQSWPEQKIHRSQSSKSAQSEPTPTTTPLTPGLKRSSVDMHELKPIDGEDGGIILDFNRRRVGSCEAALNFASFTVMSPHERRVNALNKLEEKRNEKLRQKQVIGQVTNKTREVDFRISQRKVNFRWQRGIKIGEGQFGKVYTAVNMDTGELMAMKELRFQPTDHKAFRQLIDEIKNVEGITHDNLVKYYGIEVHKDEMLIFMEYCDRGTIQDAAKGGLPEYMIRLYTREILVAINHLHEYGIVHRDIKGANIFLTSTGSVKLGDFGSSVKLKSHSTIPGEFNSVAGTTAYMAPEVITGNDKEGHGRSADIWSFGCVVIEMMTGKRPWHELESNFQIMYKVGVGCRPSIPDNTSEEGRDFLLKCLVPNPDDRWTAGQLQNHPFTKVDSLDS